MHSLIKLSILAGLFIPALASAQTQTLPLGWSMVGNDTGAAINANSVFGNATAPTAISSSVTTVWTWNNAQSQWNFFTPSMTPLELSTYAATKGYGVLSSIAKGEGFWVNAKSQFVYDPANTGGPINFSVMSAWGSLVANGMTRYFTITGTCSGSVTLTQYAPTAGVTFENIAGRFSSVRTLNGTLSNCTPATLAVTTTQYYDSNYIPLGTSSAGNYSVFSMAPTLPTTAKVGDTATLGTLATYTDSSKSVQTGFSMSSITIEPDTATTAIVNLTARVYNMSNILTLTEQDRYRITAAGAMSMVSIETQASNGSAVHLMFK